MNPWVEGRGLLARPAIADPQKIPLPASGHSSRTNFLRPCHSPLRFDPPDASRSPPVLNRPIQSGTGQIKERSHAALTI